MLRIARAQLVSKVCGRQTSAIAPLAARGLKSSAIVRYAADNEHETTSLSGRKFVPKFAQEEHIQINWRKRPRTEPPVVLPRKAAELPVDEAYSKLYVSPAPVATKDHASYPEFVEQVKHNLLYLKVPKKLRPLIFREKNAEVLDELNILYPNGDPAEPLSPRTRDIDTKTINELIAGAETIEELNVARTMLRDVVVYAPDTVGPVQLMMLYEKVLQVGGFGKAESILNDHIFLDYLLQEAARVGTLRSRLIYRTKHTTRGLRDVLRSIRNTHKINVTKDGHVELPVQLLVIYYLSTVGLASDFSPEIVQTTRKYKIDPSMNPTREGSAEAALRARIMYKNFVGSATRILEDTVKKGISKLPQEVVNDMYLDASICLESLTSPKNDWNVDTQILAKNLKAYLALLEGADKKAVSDKVNFYQNTRSFEEMSPEAKAAADKVAAAKKNPEPTASEEVREGIYDKEPTVDGKTVKQMDAEAAKIGQDAEKNKAAYEHPVAGSETMSPEAKAAADKVAAAKKNPEPTASEQVREGIYDKEPTVDGKTVKQMNAEEAQIGLKERAKADGMSVEAQEAADKVAAAKKNPEPTASEQVREGIYDKEPTVDGKTVKQMDAEAAKIGQDAEKNKAAYEHPVAGSETMSPEAKAAAQKVAAAKKNAEPTYSEEVREGIYDKEPTVDGKTVKQLDAEEEQIGRDAAAKLRAEGKLPKE